MIALIVLVVFVAVALAAPRYGVDSRAAAGRTALPGGSAVPSARASLRSDLAAVRSLLARGLHRHAAH